MGVSRAFVFLLGAVLGGGLLFALLYPRILALEGKVKGLSFRLEAQKAENRALQEEARRAQEELRRPEKMKPGLPPEGQGGGLGLGLSDSGVRAAVLDLTLQAHEVEAALFRKEEAREGRWAWQRPSWPLAAPFWVSSPFGQRLSPFGTGVEFHEGLDLAALRKGGRGGGGGAHGGLRVSRGQVPPTGYHLHFGLYRGGVPLDPWPFLMEAEAWR